MENSTHQIVFTGSGGQGLITAAIVLGEAAVIHEGLEAVQSQSYGAAARGGATRADVIISTEKINIPKINQAGVLLCLTQEAYTRFGMLIRPGGLFITDTRFVKAVQKLDAIHIELDLYNKVVEEIGKPVVFNIAILGALLGIYPVVKKDSVVKALEHRFPPALRADNLKALELGLTTGNLYHSWRF